MQTIFPKHGRRRIKKRRQIIVDDPDQSRLSSPQMLLVLVGVSAFLWITVRMLVIN